MQLFVSVKTCVHKMLSAANGIAELLPYPKCMTCIAKPLHATSITYDVVLKFASY